MTIADLFTQYLEHLFAGKRCEARELILAAQDRGVGADKLLKAIIWPAMEQIEKLHRQNVISRVVEHMATRINRLIADQLQAFLPREPKTGKRMIVTCGDGEPGELGAQMVADLFEANGWSVWFLGSGIPNDEVLSLVHKVQPDILCMYGTLPAGVPNMKRLVEQIREIGACNDLQIMVSGGVFNRADGLADEIKADLFAPNIVEALQVVEEHPTRVPKDDTPEPGRRRKRRRLPAMRTAKEAVVV